MVEESNELKLQRLVNEKNLTLEVVKDEKGFPAVNITFPPPPEPFSTYDTTCKGCGKLAKAVLETDTKNAGEGIKINFHNLLKYEVIGCRMALLNAEASIKAENDYINGIESDDASLLDLCLDTRYVPLNEDDQPRTLNRLWSIIYNLIKERDIKLRPARPPLVSKVRKALTVSK